MEIRKEDIERFKSLSDIQLREAIGQVADALGANPAQKRRAQNNVGYIRRKIGDGKNNEIMRQLESLPPEVRADILNRIKR